jgi:hypothetical protein
MTIEYTIGGKWLELLQEIAPSLTRAAVLRDPVQGSGNSLFAVIQAMAPSLRMEVKPISTRDAPEIERTVAAFAGALADDLVAVANSWGLVTGSNGLGNMLVDKGTEASSTTLASFIEAIAAMPGHTYMGNNGTDTFIFTDTQNGHTGAIEMASVFSGTKSTISNHVLTLHT